MMNKGCMNHCRPVYICFSQLCHKYNLNQTNYYIFVTFIIVNLILENFMVILNPL